MLPLGTSSLLEVVSSWRLGNLRGHLKNWGALLSKSWLEQGVHVLPGWLEHSQIGLIRLGESDCGWERVRRMGLNVML